MSFQEWKNEVLEQHPDATFEGDADVAHAMRDNDLMIAIWNGEDDKEVFIREH